MKEQGGLDLFRIAAALLVIAIHTISPESIGGGYSFLLTRILARLAVPFFLMVTGHFVLSFPPDRVKKYLNSSLKAYLAVTLLYLPLSIYGGYFEGASPYTPLKLLLFDGVYYHLWYFPAMIMGIFIVRFLQKHFSPRSALAICVFLYFIGLSGDSYYGFAAENTLISTAYNIIFSVSTYTRNGIFMTPLFLLLGNSAPKASISERLSLYGFGTSFLLMTGEGMALRLLQVQRHDSMYLFLPLCAFFLYRLLLIPQIKPFPSLRKICGAVYVIHPALIIFIRGISKLLGKAPPDDFLNFAAVSVISFSAAALLHTAKKFLRKS